MENGGKTPDNSEALQTETATIRLGDDGIIRHVLRQGAYETVETARESIGAIVSILEKLDLSGGKKCPVLVILKGGNGISLDGRKFYARVDEYIGPLSLSIVTALVTVSPIEKVIGNFLVGLYKPNHPMKLFNTEEDAVAWLRTFLE